MSGRLASRRSAARLRLAAEPRGRQRDHHILPCAGAPFRPRSNFKDPEKRVKTRKRSRVKCLCDVETYRDRILLQSYVDW